MRSRPYFDEGTIESWRIDPPLHPIDLQIDEAEQDPPLWKDLTLAVVVVVILWILAAVVSG